MGKLGQLLNLRAAQAQAQQQQQTATQRKNIAAYDWNKHLGEDGTLDVESFARDQDAPVIFGDQYIDYLQKAAVAKQTQLAQKSTLLTLRSEQRKALAESLGALRSDKDVAEDTPEGRQKVNDELIKFRLTYGDDVQPVLEAYGGGLAKVPKGRMSDALKAMQLQAFSAEQQANAQLPQYVSKGSALTNVNPSAAGVPPDIKMELPPGAVLVQDANGRFFYSNPQNNQVTPIGSGRGGAGGGQPSLSASPNAPTFTQPVPQQKELEEHVSTTRKADADYGANRHVNDEILRLSADTSTGPGSSLWHTGALGKITGTFGGNAAADYQKIGAYLDRQAAMSASQMGLPETNAGLQTAANLSGTTDYTPAALQTKVKLTDAMVEGAHQYRKGLDKVVGTGANQDLSKLQDFRAQWADNFDPNVFRVENAIKRGDKKELAAIKAEVGTRGMAELKEKSDNLEKLERGELLQ